MDKEIAERGDEVLVLRQQSGFGYSIAFPIKRRERGLDKYGNVGLSALDLLDLRDRLPGRYYNDLVACKRGDKYFTVQKFSEPSHGEKLTMKKYSKILLGEHVMLRYENLDP